MPYTLPIQVDPELINPHSASIARQICKDLSTAENGDIVGIVIPYDQDAAGILHQGPIKDVIVYEAPPCRQSYRTLPILHGDDVEEQMRLCWQAKRVELTTPAWRGRLQRHAQALLNNGGVNNSYRLVLTNSAALFYHASHIDHIGTRFADPLDLPQFVADLCLRAILPGGYTAHEIIEITAEIEPLCELATDLVTLFDAKKEVIPFTSPDLSILAV
jgi:hypothetical protein